MASRACKTAGLNRYELLMHRCPGRYSSREVASFSAMRRLRYVASRHGDSNRAMDAVGAELQSGLGIELVWQRLFDQFSAVAAALRCMARGRHCYTTLAPIDEQSRAASAVG